MLFIIVFVKYANTYGQYNQTNNTSLLWQTRTPPKHKNRVRVRVMVFNATFNNISVISWRSVLLVEEIGVPGEHHRPAASHSTKHKPM